MGLERALEGVKVVDFGWVLVSPLIVKSLADYGATAVFVESIVSPSISRTGTPYKDGKPGVDRAGHFAYCAPNKLSISLNTRTPGGMEIARKLVAWADVLSENRRAGVMKAMGMDYESLTKINPELIMVSSSNQGQTGPFASHPGLGLHLTGLGGFNNFLGSPEDEAMTLSVAYTDYLAPPLAVATIAGALDYRRKYGKGQFLDVSQLEVGLQFVSAPVLDYNVSGKEPERIGNSCAGAAPHGIFRCQGEDRWCAIAVFTETEWVSFCNTLSISSLLSDDRFSTLQQRKANEAALNTIIGECTVKYTPEDLMKLLQGAGVAAGVVQNAKDVYEDVQLRDRNFFWVMNHTEMGEFTHQGQPAILSETPAKPYMPSPCLGEHTEYICREFLEMSEDEYIDHMASGSFGF